MGDRFSDYTHNPLPGTNRRNVFAVCVARIMDRTVVASYSPKKEGYCREPVMALLTANNLTLRPRERVTVDGGATAIHCMADDRDRVYIMITDADYPQRVSYLGLEELQSKFLDRTDGVDVDSVEEDGLNRRVKGTFKEVLQKYEQVEDFDQLAELHSKVDMVRMSMVENVQTALANADRVENLEASSERLNQDAKLFQDQSSELRRRMRCKNIKMYIVISLVVLTILLAVIVPVVIQIEAQKKKDDEE
mmetsp:Transcript_3566/g.10249  ORF Transcript_3566/g.10249 Transcript_3566/m.10249 type:complete len:249 (-) Transcript_3566:76-822(-)